MADQIKSNENQLKTILFIEDDQIDRMAFERYAKKNAFPYAYKLAASLQTAREVINKTDISAVVVDYQLGDGTAFDLFEYLEKIPFIVITGLGDQEVAVKAMKAGAYDYLVKDKKGAHLSTLAIIIENAIKRKQAEEELELYRQHLESIVQTRTIELQREIEERKQTEIALRESEEKYSSVVENSNDGIVVVQDSKIMYANPAAENISGYNKEDILGLEFIVHVVPEHKNIISQRYAETMAGIGDRTPYEIDMLRRDSQRITIEISSNLILYKELPAVLIFMRDVTERKKTAEDLLKVQLGIERLNEPVIITDSNGKITYVNPNFDKTYKFASEEILGNTLEILTNLESQNDEVNLFWNSLPRTDIVNGETCYVNKLGLQIDVEVSINPILNGTNNIIGYLVFHHDITERKKYQSEIILAKEKAESADRLKSEFLAQMSHEIRTPINTILSFSSLLKSQLEDKVDVDLKSCFNGVSNAGSRIIRTIDLLLNVSEVQVGSYDFISTKVSICSDVLEKLYREKFMFCKDKGIELILNFRNEDCQIEGDEYSINQIMENLLDNAIKYTNSGYIEIASSLVGNNKLQIDIIDTGIGISEKYLNKIFEPFTQEDQGYTRRFEGNGLGLALVKQYCKMNSAEIKVESKKGKGSKFSVIFPLACS